jgi:hypothetical protein
MWWQRLILGLLAEAILAGLVAPAAADDKEGHKARGTVTGVLTEKKLDTPWWVTVKADGEEKARRYWGYGALPSAALSKQLAACPVGSRVRLTWEVPEANEGPHVARVELLKAPAKGNGKPTGAER